MRKELQVHVVTPAMPLRELKTFLSNCSGADLVQLRFKNASGSPSLSEGEMREAIAHAKNVLDCPVIVNDRVDLANDADGVHLGQKDEPWWRAKKAFPNKIVGLSIESEGNLEKLAREMGEHGIRPDYLGVGPVFATNSKNDAAKPSVELLERTRSFLVSNGLKIPIVAIGGVTPGNASRIKGLCEGVAAISVFRENPRAAIRAFKRR